MMAPSPGQHNRPCLLALDGGGVRGLSTLLILRDVMARVNQDREKAARVRPCQVMDLMGGTSTGGSV